MMGMSWQHVSRKQTWFHKGHMLETAQLLDEKVFEDMSDPPMFITVSSPPCISVEQQNLYVRT